MLIISIIILIVFAILFSYIFYHRSLTATIVEMLIKFFGNGLSNNMEKSEKYIDELLTSEEKAYELPNSRFKSSVEDKILNGCRVVIFNQRDENENIIIYLHGGAYVKEMRSFHVKFCDKLAAKSNSTVYVPIYPIAPKHNYKESFDFLENFYKDLLKLDKPITIMGDSAGGGLSAAFCQYLAEINLPQPKHLILLSPWVDVSMSNKNYGDYANTDPMLGVESLRYFAKFWADDLDLKDYKVSPLYGDVSKFGDTTIFVGTREIFYQDILEFYEKFDKNKVRLIVGEGMNHVYPIYPIPEARKAFKEILEIINNG